MRNSIAASLSRFAFVVALAVVCCAIPRAARAEQTSDYAVQVSASVTESPPSIKLSWPAPTVTPSQFRIYRKTQSATSFGSPVATVSGTTLSWTDTNVSVGAAYEYKLDTNGSYGTGFIYAGIRAPLKDLHGKVILVVDNSIMGAMPNELTQLQQDLTGDGWQVIRHDVGRGDVAPTVKQLIQNDYNADPSNVKAVFLFGHVPVPYSGDINPDGHAEHKGAWGADCYYGIMGGSWSDNSVNDTQSSADGQRNWNTPGDGKFDSSTLPQDVTLQVGRVDLGGLGQFAPKTETDLLKNYLVKDHNFRMNQIQLQRRGIVDDNFGTFGGEAFAANGWRNFAPMFGANNITVINSSNTDTNTSTFFGTLSSQSYLWAYGCGAGYFYSCLGVGKTDNYAQNDPKAAFYMLFGSFFGDWDSSMGNYLRAPLGSQTAGLASVWAGRPNWFFHHMALGETLGYSTVLAQNNNGLYPTGQAARQVHIALMGDPTLHMHTVQPPGSLSGSSSNLVVNLSWGASSDSNIVGYHVYRATSASGPFTRVTGSPVSGTSYSDTAPASGTYTYVVRAIKLESSASGTYYNPSQGVFATVTTGSGGSTNQPPTITSQATATPNPATTGQSVSFAVAATDPNNDPLSASWNFGDGATASGFSGSHSYSTAGTYNVTVTISDGKGGTCSSGVSVTVNSTSGGGGSNQPPVITAPLAAYPNNPALGQKVLFTIGASDPNGDALTYSYDYGDGSTGYVESHVYNTAGNYTAKITVTDTHGASASSSTPIVAGGGGSSSGGGGSGGGGTSGSGPTITNPLAAYPNNPAIGQKVLFAVGVSDPNGGALTYKYDYGDGTTGYVENHTYNTAATCTAKITITDSLGASATSSVVVTCGGGGSGGSGGTGGGTGGGTSGGPTITAGLAAYPNVASVGQTVLFTVSVSDPNGGALTYKYNYGDGTTGYTESHKFSATGSYTVTLTVTDSTGASASTSTGVTVK